MQIIFKFKQWIIKFSADEAHSVLLDDFTMLKQATWTVIALR